MKAIHVNWTAPFFHKHRLRGHGFQITRDLESPTYDVPDYQMLYTILSALRWKLHNGPIKLYTDSIGLSLYQQWGLVHLYDEIDTDFLDNINEENIVDPAYFWTSGKIRCLANEKEPFVFLDQDFIVRGEIDPSFYEADLGVGHWEIPRGFYYFNEEQWRKDIKHIEFPERYSCTAYSPNTSFLYFKNLKVVEDYVDWHMKMVKTNGEDIPEWFWLATDQGILGHVIREGDYTTSTITDKIFLADSDYGTKETRRIGMSEQWYWPKDADHSKDDFVWEHVWLAKIVYGWDPDFMARETQRYFDECWAFGGQKYLMHYKLSKYWDENKHAEQ